MRSWSSLFLALVVVWAFAFTSREAWGQITPITSGPSVSGILGTVTRCEPTDQSCGTSADNAGQNPHPNGVLVNVENFEDCSANLYYQFELGIATPSTSYQLMAWAGTQDCSQLANRQTSATSVCWPVSTPVAFNANQYNLNIRMQDIASGAFTTTHPTSYVPAGADSCQAQVATGAQIVTLYFFFVDGGSNPVGTVQQYPVTLDLRAGDVQGAITAGVGDTILIVNIPATTDPDTQGWNVYCDPPPGQESASETVAVDAASNNGLCPTGSTPTGPSDALAPTTDALVSEDAALEDGAVTPGAPQNDEAGGNACGVPLNDSGIPAPGGCSTSSVLVPGGGSSNLIPFTDDAGQTIYEEAGTTISDEAGVSISGGNMVLGLQFGEPNGTKFLCAQIGGTSTTVTVPNIGGVPYLKDGYFYNIAVAATDAAGNVGPLSNVACGEPVPVADFWRVYYDDGGRAGGSFCSAEGIGTPAGTGGLGVLMVAGVVGIIRRRRRS